MNRPSLSVLVVLHFVCALSLSARAQVATGAPEAAPASAAESAPKERIRVLVLSLNAATGVEAETAKLLDDLVSVRLSDYPDFNVISDADVRQLMQLEADRQAVGCDEDASCLAEVAGAMGAQYVVSGRVGKLGSRFSLTFSLYDSAKATSVGRENISGDSLDAVADAMPGGIDRLVEPLVAELGLRGASGSAPATATAPTASDDGGSTTQTTKTAKTTKVSKTVEADPVAAAEPETELSLFGVLGTSACGGLGVALMAGGLVFEGINLFALEGADNALGPLDFVGTGLGAVGVLVAVGALAAAPFLWWSDVSPEEGESAEGGA